ncbi:MAG: hypothetical protein KDC38_20755 [Planctomycetes bacterium]|nr:hypothetical protein [Planctomycetota bacterium]
MEERGHFDESRWRDALTRSFALGRLFGFEVRVHWMVFIYFLLALGYYAETREGASGTQEGSIAILALAGVIQLFGIVLIHELGHAFAARRRGLLVDTVELDPLGALGTVRGIATPQDELVVTAWGPAVHPLLLILVGVPYLLARESGIEFGFYPESFFAQFFSINAGLLALHLVPTFPLDGGRLLRAALALRMGPIRATIIAALIGKVAVIIALIIGLYELEHFKILLVVLGALCFLACHREGLLAKELGPYESASFPLSFEPRYDSFRLDDVEESEDDRGIVRRYLDARAERKRARDAIDEEAIRQRVDLLLEKVSAVGLQGLTPEERRFLERASDLYRRSSSSSSSP